MIAFTTPSQAEGVATKLPGRLAIQPATKPGLAPGIVAAVLLFQLGIMRMLATADVDHVWILGRELRIGCWFREAFGAPCPACGLTRSVIMTLHGDFRLAWEVNPAGLLAVVGAVLFSFAMLWLMILQRRATTLKTLRTNEQAIKRATLAYAGLLILVLLTRWAAEVWLLHTA